MQMATLQVKRVPDDLYEKIEQRAEAEGVSLSEYVLRMLRADVQLVPLRESLPGVARTPSGRCGTSTPALLTTDARLARGHHGVVVTLVA